METMRWVLKKLGVRGLGGLQGEAVGSIGRSSGAKAQHVGLGPEAGDGRRHPGGGLEHTQEWDELAEAKGSRAEREDTRPLVSTDRT